MNGGEGVVVSPRDPRLRMEHFSEEVWVDFVRGATPLASVQQLQRHLEFNCPECNGALEFWQGIVNFAAEEQEFAPTADLVHLVKTEFQCSQAEEFDSPMIATMIFDTACQLVPVGLRSGPVSTRQVVYEADGLTVDMRFERNKYCNLISASGQVLDKDSPLTWLGNAAIVLWTNQGRMVTKTETNKCGEFQLEFPPQDQLRLSVITEGRRTLRIVLGNLE
jgi:hypothetical protein